MVTPSLTTSEIVALASPVPLADALVLLAILTGFVTEVTATAGATVSFVAVFESVAVLPDLSVAVAVNVIVPSASELTLMPVIVQLPSDPTVVE